MSDNQPNLDSLFLAASEIESKDGRDAFLADACGDDLELRQQIEQLLQSDQHAGSFLEKPAPGLDATIARDASGENRSASLDAGLATAFSPEDAVVIGDANHSVLKMLGNTLNEVPRVSLRESQTEGDDPISKPNSPEVPQSDSDSRYRLDGEIARGGMGAIIKGRDIDLGRDLAIKVLLDSHKDKPEVIQRFVEEAQIGGQLQHPGIAPIYELGQFADKRPFFAMKLVKGQTLSKLLADREDAADERGKLIGIFEQICQTMAYAHSRGVIHRDLKPANIMVGAFGEVQVMDWGLAKVLSSGGVADEKTALKKQQGETLIQTMRSVGSDAPGTVGSVGSETQMGSVMGTPAYMPPEQALGEIDQMDERADVFGLGAILAEILTGKPPYVADDGTQVFRMASRGKLGDCFTRLDECGADEELVSLAKRCLELEPADRPKDANALAEQVTGYLESVETKLRVTEVERAGEAARVVEQRKRFRVTLGLGAAALSILVAGIAATAWQANNAFKQTEVAELASMEAKREADNAREAEQEAIKAKTTAEDAQSAEETAKEQQKEIARQRRRELYAANMQLADQLYNGQNGEQFRIEQLLAAWIPIDDQEEDLREFSWRYQWNRLYKSAKVTVPPYCKGVAITPSGKMLVTDSNGLHEVDENGKKRELISWTLNVNWSYFSPDGRWVAANIGSGIEIYQIESRKKVLSIPQNRCSFSANGEYVAAWKSLAKVDSLAEGEDAIPVWKLEPDGTVNSLAPLVIGETEQLPSTLAYLKLGSDGKSFLLRDSPGLVTPNEVGAFLNGNPEPLKWRHAISANNCTWSPDGKIIASSGINGAIELRLTSDVTQKLTISTHGKSIETIRFSLDGKVLATGGGDGTIDVWDVSELASIANSETRNQQSGKTGERKAPSIRSAVPRIIRTIKAHIFPISELEAALNFSADGALLASRDSIGNVKLWTLTETKVDRLSESFGTAKYYSGSRATQFDLDRIAEDQFSGGINLQSFSSDQRDARIGKVSPGDIVEGNVEIGERIVAVFDSNKAGWKELSEVKETWDDLRLLTRGRPGTTIQLKLENAQKEQHEVTLRRTRLRDPASYSVAFSPDGEQVVVADSILGVTQLNLRTGTAIRYRKTGFSVAYSPDGRLLAIAGLECISILDSETGKELYQLDSHEEVLKSLNNRVGGNLAFSPDGKFLAHVSGYRYATDRSDLTVWRTSDFKKIGGSPLHKTDFTMQSVIFSPDSSLLLVGDNIGRVLFWDTSNWKSRGGIPTPHKQIGALAVSPDGERLYVGSNWRARSVTIWDMETREQLHRLNSQRVGYMALSPDGRTLAVGSFDHNISLWDAHTGKRLQTIQAHADSVFGVAFSRDGKRLATVDQQAVLRFWDAETKNDISEDSDTIEAILRLGQWRSEQGRYEEAEKLFTRTLELNRKAPHLRDEQIAYAGKEFAKQGLKETRKWPTIEKQPTSVGITLGEKAILSVQVKDGDWSYRWYHRKKLIEGATDSTLTIPNVSADDLGAYYVKICPKGYEKAVWQQSSTAFIYRESYPMLRRLLCELFPDIPGGQLQSLKASEAFQKNQPARIRSLGQFQFIDNEENNLGMRISGYLKPPKTGEYVFYLSSDDEGELYISSDESKDKLELIASVKIGPSGIGNESGHTARGDWGKNPTTVSKPIYLEAGRRYAIKALLKESMMDAHLAVTWQMPGDPPPKQNAPPIANKYLEFAVDNKPIADATQDPTSFVGRGLAYLSTQQWDLARAEWRRAVELQPDLIEDAFVAFRDAKQWGTAAEFAQQILQRDSPSPAWRWLKYVPVFVRGEAPETYSKFSRNMTEAFPASSATLADIDCVLKVSLIWPGKLNISKPHADRHAELLDELEQPTQLTPWAWGTRALLALRTGDAEAAVDYVARSEQLNPIDMTRSFNQAVLAMAHMELNQHDEGKAALSKAKELITSLKQDPVKKDKHDTLIAEILYREAEAKSK